MGRAWASVWARPVTRAATTSETRSSRRPVPPHCTSGEILATDSAAPWPHAGAATSADPSAPLAQGLSEPVEAVEILWEPISQVGAAPVPPPGRLAPHPMSALSGSAEAEAIAAALKRVTSGGSREVVVVSGEPGLGKTTLVAEMSRTAFDVGSCALFGHCEEDLATPYQLFAEALGHFVTHAPEEQRHAHVDGHGSPARPTGASSRESDPGHYRHN